MGRKRGKGRGSSAIGKIRLMSPLEWETKRGGPRPPEWRKTSRGIAKEREGGAELPRGTNTPGVEELPQGEETFGVTLEGN